jgi:hypothetical protein
MIEPGTERPKQERPPRKRGRRQDGPHTATQSQSGQAAPQVGAAEGAPRQQQPPRRRDKPRRDDRRGPPQRPPRTGAYEKRATKKLVPITEAMAEGKEYLRSFGDLLQFHKKKQEPDESAGKSSNPPTPPANGSTPAE